MAACQSAVVATADLVSTLVVVYKDQLVCHLAAAGHDHGLNQWVLHRRRLYTRRRLHRVHHRDHSLRNLLYTSLHLLHRQS